MWAHTTDIWSKTAKKFLLALKWCSSRLPSVEMAVSPATRCVVVRLNARPRWCELYAVQQSVRSTPKSWWHAGLWRFHVQVQRAWLSMGLSRCIAWSSFCARGGSWICGKVFPSEILSKFGRFCHINFQLSDYNDFLSMVKVDWLISWVVDLW